MSETVTIDMTNVRRKTTRKIALPIGLPDIVRPGLSDPFMPTDLEEVLFEYPNKPDLYLIEVRGPMKLKHPADGYSEHRERMWSWDTNSTRETDPRQHDFIARHIWGPERLAGSMTGVAEARIASYEATMAKLIEYVPDGFMDEDEGHETIVLAWVKATHDRLKAFERTLGAQLDGEDAWGNTFDVATEVWRCPGCGELLVEDSEVLAKHDADCGWTPEG